MQNRPTDKPSIINEQPTNEELARNEWDDVIHQLNSWQADVKYDNTQNVLRSFFDRVNLTLRERQAIDPSLGQLRDMARRLEQSIVQIAVFGLVGRGKSSVLNALVGETIFATGPLHGVTTTVERSPWSLTQDSFQPIDSAPIDSASDSLSHSLSTMRSPSAMRLLLPTTTNAHVELIDTPGLDEVNGEQRTILAHQVAKQADLILFVVAGDMTTVEHQALSELRQWSKPILLVFNKIDQYPDIERHQIYATIRDQRVKQLLSPDEIVMTAAAPLVSTMVMRADGQTVVKRQRGTPQVIDLKLKILDILQRDGKSLVALNTMLYADEVNEAIVQRKTEIRDRAANDLIWAIMMAKAIAMALNPITVLDVFSGATIDVIMIVLLSRLYGLPMTQHGALKLLRTIAMGMGGVSLTELLTTLGLSSLKSTLGLAAPATGGLSLAPYVSVAIAQAGVAGVSTHIIGQISKTYLANGASWGEQSPKSTINAILNSLDETSLLHRVKTELKERLR